MPVVYRDDPYASYNFEITITGVSNDGKSVKGSFQEATVGDVEVTPIDYRNGSEDIHVRKLPGLKKFANIVLKRGLIGDPTFWSWIHLAMQGKVKRAEGSLVLLDENKQPVMRWNFKRGWPSKWTGPTLNAKNNEVAMESLEITHEGLELDV